MKTFLLLCSALTLTAVKAQTFEYLDINQVKARVNSGGDLHWDQAPSAYSEYEVPAGSGKKWGGPACLWLGGVDAGGQLHLAAQTYHQSGVDFFTGPLSTLDATTTPSAVNQYNRVWKLNKTDIDAFILNFANGNVQNGSYTPVADLLSWPGNGDLTQNQSVILAPFADVNSDGIYSPMSAGDYPIIKGDQAIYTIFNDAYLAHQATGAGIIGAEIHLMAYAYGPCSVVSSNSFLNYTTFYNYKVINRSAFALSDSYVSLFNDTDLSKGFPNYNDYVGCDVQDEYGYTYNTGAANNPAIGVVQLKGPYNMSNGIDDNHDGTTDELFEQMGMTSFMYMNNSLPGIQLSQTDPFNGAEYYNYMTSHWRDGTPLTCGGNGYGGSVATNFAYPSSTFTNGACGAASWTETGSGSDKRFVLSSGPFTLAPGGVYEMEYAYITAFDSITNNPLGKLDTDVQGLRSIYNSTLNQCLTTGVKEQNSNNTFALYPNPANDVLNIETKNTSAKVKLEVTDALGKILLSEDHTNFSKATLNTGSFAPGIYFIKLISAESILVKKFTKE